MKGITKELMVLTAVLIGAYLVLVHYTGFSRAVGAGASAYIGGVKALQGR